MTKNAIMIAGLAAVVGLGTACFGMFSERSEKKAAVKSCEGLEGQAREDCEKNQTP